MIDSVYYLKYRPQSVFELDLELVREKISRLLLSGRVPHAFLFSGPKGLGKTSAARILAKAINCQKPANKRKAGFEPCNKCRFCQDIAAGRALDYIEIDAASNRGIDDIRDLREKIKLAPSQAEKKVYVIDEVHMLTKEAFNALLKVLEEPPKHAYFILCTTEPEKLPETIISRCQRIDFNYAKKEEIVRSLKRIVKGEKLKIKDETMVLIAEKAQASFRDAAKILQELAFSGKNISHKNAVETLDKTADYGEEILKHLAKKDKKKALECLGKAVAKGIEMKELALDILQRLEQKLLASFGLTENKTEDSSLSIAEVKKMAELFDKAGRQLKNSLIPALALELAIIEYHIEVENSKFKPRQKVLKASQTIDKQGRWQEFLALIKKENPSIEALLRACELKKIDHNEALIEVFYEFHKTKLEAGQYRGLIEKRLSLFYAKPLKIKFQLRR